MHEIIFAMTKKIISTFVCLIGIQFLWSQDLKTIDLLDAYLMLENRYPSLRNESILNEIYENEIEQIDRSLKPGIFLKADGRIQTESVKLDVEDGAMVPFEINQPIYSLRTYVEANYLIEDGGISEVRKKLKEVELGVNKQSIEVERFALRERVNQHFVNIFLLREQNKVFQYSLADLASRKEIISAGVEFGTVLETELAKITVRELEILAQQDNIKQRINGLINSLSNLLDVNLDPDIEMIFPELSSPTILPVIDRPETKMFELQKEAILAQADLIDANLKPQLSAFAQAGVGYPNPLNLLDNNVAPYGLVGASFIWRLTDWKKNETDRQMLSLKAKQVELAKERFDFNLKTKEASYLAEIERLQEQLNYEERIADLQGDILEQLGAQLDEGVITTTDYITQLNAELRTRQKVMILKSELLKVQLEFWNERGAF